MRFESLAGALLIAGAVSASACAAILGDFDNNGTGAGGSSSSSSHASTTSTTSSSMCATQSCTELDVSRCGAKTVTCMKPVCQQLCCGVSFTTADTPCTEDGGKVCDGAGACVECAQDAECTAPATCDTTAHKCLSPSCSDGVKDADESDQDCGGSCLPCATGKMCGSGADCASESCDAMLKTCLDPTCSDMVRNQGEADTDCAGPCPTLCALMQKCAAPGDCASGVCTGGACTLHPNGDLCAAGADCSSSNCVDGVCCDTLCDTTCSTCNGATPGTCSFVAAGSEDAPGCVTTMACDGAGKCALAKDQPCTLDAECASGTCDPMTNVCL